MNKKYSKNKKEEITKFPNLVKILENQKKYQNISKAVNNMILYYESILGLRIYYSELDLFDDNFDNNYHVLLNKILKLKNDINDINGILYLIKEKTYLSKPIIEETDIAKYEIYIDTKVFISIKIK